MSTAPNFSRYRDEYNEHGVVFLKEVLDAAAMTHITAAYEWSHAHLTGALQDFSASEAETFIADTNISAKRSVYQALLRDTVIPDIARDLFGVNSPVWYLGEQIFYKEGGKGTRRTPWHQDTSYGNFEGPMMAVVWIPLDPVDREHSLEVIRGSHRGVTYNGSRFAPGDDTAPLYPVSEMPRLPDIEQERHKWDIAGSDLSPGDLVAARRRACVAAHCHCASLATRSPGWSEMTNRIRTHQMRGAREPKPKAKPLPALPQVRRLLRRQALRSGRRTSSCRSALGNHGRFGNDPESSARSAADDLHRVPERNFSVLQDPATYPTTPVGGQRLRQALVLLIHPHAWVRLTGDFHLEIPDNHGIAHHIGRET